MSFRTFACVGFLTARLASATCTLEAGFDCQGSDISSQALASPEECCSLCGTTAGCGGFTHAQYDGGGRLNPTCYLKTSCSTKVADSTCTAGNADGPPPKPTPAPSPGPSLCEAGKNVSFPHPTVGVKRGSLTDEQQWMADHWPGYQNGVSLGGLFVIEDWMFRRTSGRHDPATLHLQQNEAYSNHAWSQDLLKGDLQTAYATMDCHLQNYYSDEALDDLATFGINAVRLPVGYWLFDDTALYPNDPWVHEPSDSLPYGVNPDGFITPGTVRLSDMVVRLWNRNIKVILDMHALPGCSSPHQSYAGIYCEAGAPNYWNGHASDGISGGTKVQRAADGKSWSDVGRKIALERVVPWLKFIDAIAPGAILAYELVNEPDIGSGDASESQVRAMTLELGKDVDSCLNQSSVVSTANSVRIGVSNAAHNMPTSTIARDYKSSFNNMRDSVWTDIHHYFAWGGCSGPDYQCVCEAGLPGTSQSGEDADWAGYINSGVFEEGWRFYVGEWSASVPQGPDGHRAGRMWLAQKWGYLSQYLHYKGKAVGGESSFLGDYYWSARMGYNWDPSPSVCSGSTSTTDYLGYSSWDWNLIRLIKLDLVQPLSKLGFSIESMDAKKATACQGSLSDKHAALLV